MVPYELSYGCPMVPEGPEPTLNCLGIRTLYTHCAFTATALNRHRCSVFDQDHMSSFEYLGSLPSMTLAISCASAIYFLSAFTFLAEATVCMKRTIVSCFFNSSMVVIISNQARTSTLFFLRKLPFPFRGLCTREAEPMNPVLVTLALIFLAFMCIRLS